MLQRCKFICYACFITQFIISPPYTAQAFLPRGLDTPKTIRRNVHLLAQENNDDVTPQSQSHRREFLKSMGLLPLHFASSSIISNNFVYPAYARGLVKFPCSDYQFLNNYIFLRAGESLLEEEGVWSTNPLFLTNREASLSERGIEQVEETCRRLKEQGIQPTILRYSLAAAAIDTADILGKELKVGRNNMVPEFNFMDPRAIGRWDMLPLATTQSAVWAMDVKEAGNYGEGGRPPPNEDSTPHETLADQVVRLRQLISVLETQYSGDTILLVFPDGTGPALLECLIGGIPLNRVHEFEYQSGEVRVNVNYDGVQKYKSYVPSDHYLTYIQNGEEELKALRAKGDQILNVRDQQYEVEQKLIEERKMKEEQETLEQKMKEEAAKQIQISERKISDGNNDQSSNIAVIAGLAAIGSAGVFTILGGDSNEDFNEDIKNSVLEKELGSSDGKTEAANETSLLDINKPIPLLIEPISPIVNVDKSARSKNVVKDGVNEVQEVKNVDLDVKSVAPDDDDGTDAWLGALSEIMNEEDV